MWNVKGRGHILSGGGVAKALSNMHALVFGQSVSYMSTTSPFHTQRR